MSKTAQELIQMMKRLDLDENDTSFDDVAIVPKVSQEPVLDNNKKKAKRVRRKTPRERLQDLMKLLTSFLFGVELLIITMARIGVAPESGIYAESFVCFATLITSSARGKLPGLLSFEDSEGNIRRNKLLFVSLPVYAFVEFVGLWFLYLVVFVYTPGMLEHGLGDGSAIILTTTQVLGCLKFFVVLLGFVVWPLCSALQRRLTRNPADRNT